MKAGYKIVVEDTYGYLISCTVKTPEHFVVYRPLRWSYPRRDCGPLCVFKSEAAAASFMYHYKTKNPILYRCHYIPSHIATIWFCRTELYNRMIMGLYELPPGTDLATQVRLMGRIR